MDTIRWIAKAITAAITAGTAAVATYNLEVPPVVLVVAAMIVAGLAVFVVPNGDR